MNFKCKMSDFDELIADLIVEYYAGSGAAWASDKTREFIAMVEKDWFNLPCDKDGASPEQEAMMDEFLEQLVHEITDLDKIWSKDFELVYEGDRGPDGSYHEYDGLVINASDEKMAYYIMEGLAGEYGIPELGDYSLKEV